MQSFFVLINEIKGKLLRVTRDSGVYQGRARRDGDAAVTLEASGTTKKGAATTTTTATTTTATTTTTTTKTEKAGQPATKYTSFNSETGANFTSYSFTKEKDGQK